MNRFFVYCRHYSFVKNPMQNNSRNGVAGIWLFVVVIVAVGGFFWIQNSSTDRYMPPPPKTDTEKTVSAPTETIITYSTDGFSPNTITVKKGGTVIFQNKTGKPASIASGPHPTHTVYPEFDQYKTDQRGKDEFRFVFEKVGSWGYHDHLNANMTGTIVVTE